MKIKYFIMFMMVFNLSLTKAGNVAPFEKQGSNVFVPVQTGVTINPAVPSSYTAEGMLKLPPDMGGDIDGGGGTGIGREVPMQDSLGLYLGLFFLYLLFIPIRQRLISAKCTA